MKGKRDVESTYSVFRMLLVHAALLGRALLKYLLFGGLSRT